MYMYIHTMMRTPMIELKVSSFKFVVAFTVKFSKEGRGWRVLKNPVSISYMFNRPCPISALDMKF